MEDLVNYNYLEQQITNFNLEMQDIASPVNNRKNEIVRCNNKDIQKKYNACGVPEWNNGIIISSLCPFNETKEVNIDILKNIYTPYSDLPILPNIDRIEYVKSWLNMFYQDNKALGSILVELPFSRYNVDIPALGLKNNPKFNYIRKDLLFYLDKLYNKIKEENGLEKLHITSAYRDPAYNALCGYSDFDSHIIGCAVDICGNDFLINKIKNYAENMGFGGIGKGSNIIHLDLNAFSRWFY